MPKPSMKWVQLVAAAIVFASAGSLQATERSEFPCTTCGDFNDAWDIIESQCPEYPPNGSITCQYCTEWVTCPWITECTWYDTNNGPEMYIDGYCEYYGEGEETRFEQECPQRCQPQQREGDCEEQQ